MSSLVQIIAHRGASHDAPENTLAAIDLAWQQGADAAEVDVRLSRDGHIIVCHDDNTRRTTGVTGKVSELTLEQIRSLDAGFWKGSAWRGEKIPTLAEVLDHLPLDKRLFVEIKCGTEILPALEDVLERSAARREQVTLIGFDIPTMKEAKQRFPHIAVLLLFQFSRVRDIIARRWDSHIAELIAHAKETQAEGLDLHHIRLDDLAWIAKVKASRLNAMVWTVDDAREAHRLVNAGIEGITTNRPGWLRQQLNL